MGILVSGVSGSAMFSLGLVLLLVTQVISGSVLRSSDQGWDETVAKRWDPDLAGPDWDGTDFPEDEGWGENKGKRSSGCLGWDGEGEPPYRPFPEDCKRQIRPGGNNPHKPNPLEPQVNPDLQFPDGPAFLKRGSGLFPNFPKGEGKDGDWNGHQVEPPVDPELLQRKRRYLGDWPEDLIDWDKVEKEKSESRRSPWEDWDPELANEISSGQGWDETKVDKRSPWEDWDPELANEISSGQGWDETKVDKRSRDPDYSCTHGKRSRDPDYSCTHGKRSSGQGWDETKVSVFPSRDRNNPHKPNPLEPQVEPNLQFPDGPAFLKRGSGLFPNFPKGEGKDGDWNGPQVEPPINPEILQRRRRYLGDWPEDRIDWDKVEKEKSAARRTPWEEWDPELDNEI